MSATIDALRLRKVLGRSQWGVPTQFGPDGWLLGSTDGLHRSVVVTAFDWDGEEWIHASIAGPEMPTYEDLVRLREAAFGDGYAYQVFAPSAQHVNIHEHALHLWGRADGKPVLPEFGAGGSI